MLAEDVQVKKGLGSIMSYANAISTNTRALSTCRALTECSCNAIRIEVLKEIMESNNEFEEKIFINSVNYLVHIYSERAGPLKNIDERRLAEFLRHKATFKRLDPHSKVLTLKSSLD